jgi:hypothetical protein
MQVIVASSYSVGHYSRLRRPCQALKPEKSPVVAVPVTLEDFIGIILQLELQEFSELWIASLNLFSCCESMISKVVGFRRA